MLLWTRLSHFKSQRQICTGMQRREGSETKNMTLKLDEVKGLINVKILIKVNYNIKKNIK